MERGRVGLVVVGLIAVVTFLTLFMKTAWYGGFTGRYFSQYGFFGAQYILVIDAGSSGTRINAFVGDWVGEGGFRQGRRESPGSRGLPSMEQIPASAASNKIPYRQIETRRAYQRVETEPGLASFLSNTGDINGKALEPLLQWARAVVPKSRWKKTPVLLLATAGMRRLSIVDQRHILEECRNVLAQSGFWFERDFARVIRGEDEGIFGWVSLNAQAKSLGSKDTIGALDLGGSSLEVTFDVGQVARSSATDNGG